MEQYIYIPNPAGVEEYFRKWERKLADIDGGS
jgi:hypothetical protein